jgi:hypothetical protein
LSSRSTSFQIFHHPHNSSEIVAEQPEGSIATLAKQATNLPGRMVMIDEELVVVSATGPIRPADRTSPVLGLQEPIIFLSFYTVAVAKLDLPPLGPALPCQSGSTAFGGSLAIISRYAALAIAAIGPPTVMCPAFDPV